MSKIISLLTKPDEAYALGRMYFAAQAAKRLPKDPSLAFCYDMLNKVSRSFAIVIQQLPVELRNAVCVFYLVLRGLDTVEDDMAIDEEEKLQMLLDFCDNISQRGFKMDNCGTGHYKNLMLNFGMVTEAYLGLEETYQDVIYDICYRMGKGMAEFIPKEVVTIAEYDLYCHYVAGLVGIGLSQLFSACGLEDKSFAKMEGLSNDMGLFLQKTNIIRDYLEDIVEEPAPRMFWPREIWGKYGEELADFKEIQNRERALKCLNHMVTNALSHAPKSLDYMSKVKDPWVFRFCAIPQVMAIGTLALCYNNGKVFEGVVKIPRGQTAKIVVNLLTFEDLVKYFSHYAGIISASVKPKQDPSAKETLILAESIQEKCRTFVSNVDRSDSKGSGDRSSRMILWLLSFGYAVYAFGVGGVRESLGVAANAGDPLLDLIQKILAIICLVGLTFILFLDD